MMRNVLLTSLIAGRPTATTATTRAGCSARPRFRRPITLAASRRSPVNDLHWRLGLPVFIEIWVIACIHQ